jgi:5-hydroxyisourate hydrolase-like protein (transthyretin family)
VGTPFSQSKLQGQDLKVLVLDALNGRPQANVEVEYFCAGPPLNSALNKSITSDEGIAKISILCNDKQKIEISVFPPNNKEQCGDDAATTFSDVASVGFLSKPDAAGGIWCPTKVSKTLKPVPGQAIIFVKKPTWWQSHVAG